jgi:transposase
MLDAVGYVTRCGIEWRALPVDFPPWQAVYAFFERWSARGLPQALVDRCWASRWTGAGASLRVRTIPGVVLVTTLSIKPKPRTSVEQSRVGRSPR